MEGKTWVLVVLGLVGLYLAAGLVLRPLRWLLKLLAVVAVGLVLLVAANLLGAPLGWHVAVNPVTVLTAGVLNVPGVVMLLLLGQIL